MFIEMARAIEEQKKVVVTNIRIEVTDEKLRDFLLYNAINAFNQLFVTLKNEEKRIINHALGQN